jgi:NAD(P)-dependent dehydrogenase (short-subunit alcohol dehydrogenase family)
MSEVRGVAVVTGGAKRIGRAVCKRLSGEGWAVAVHYNTSHGEAEELASELDAGGRRAVAVKADLADISALPRLIETTADALGPVTALINNASDFQYDDLANLTLESWDRHLTVNTTAPVFLAKAMADRLPDGMSGNVVNLIDQRVWRISPEFFSYTLSKTALWDATRMLAQGLAPRVRVNAVGPGPVLQSVHQTAEDFAAEADSTLLGRATAPDEIAAAVSFILSAPAMTGQMIALDSGQHLAWSSELALADRDP